MAVPNTLHFAVLQQLRDAVLFYKPASFDDRKVIVPRRGQFDDGTEIRQTTPDVPFIMVDHVGNPQPTAQASRTVDGTDVIFSRPYRSQIQIDGYGRVTSDILDRMSIAGSFYDKADVNLVTMSGARDVSALVESETIEARYRSDATVTYTGVFRHEDVAPPEVQEFSTELIDSADQTTLRTVNYP